MDYKLHELGEEPEAGLCHLQPLRQGCGLPEGQGLLSSSAGPSWWRAQLVEGPELQPALPPSHRPSPKGLRDPRQAGGTFTGRWKRKVALACES